MKTKVVCMTINRNATLAYVYYSVNVEYTVKVYYYSVMHLYFPLVYNLVHS